MKQKKPNRSKLGTWPALKRLPVLIIIGCLIGGSTSVPFVHADQFDQQIGALESQNSAVQANLDTLAAQATSYQDEINLLQSQITSVQQQINDNLAKQAQLQQEIQADQQEITLQKQVLGTDIKAMYVDGQMSTIEELATSKSLSDFVDAQTYRNAVQTKIQETLAQITQLQNQLKEQQTQVSQLLQSQQTQQAQLDADQQQQNQLLSLNQSQQSSFNAQLSANNAQISQLRAEQIAANNAGVLKTLASGQCGGGYPNSLCLAPQDSIVDPWHMLNRECVSYTAWRVSQESSVGNALLQEYNFGNATDWPAAAEQYGAKYGVTVSTTPQAGDIAIREAIPGVYLAPDDPDVGHAMYVESVVNSSTIIVSEYNENLNGQYSEEERSTSSTYHGVAYQLQFIHFP